MVHQRRSERGRNPPAPELTIWPVGQAVKTAASHAVNVGSIPARVTKRFLIETGIVLPETGENRIVGVDDGEGPPVPIPNTEVKLTGADDTWLATAWNNRKTPTQIFLLSSAGRACGC